MGNPNWVKGGASPNPGGKPRGLVVFRSELSAAVGNQIVDVVKRALSNPDDRIALEAAKFAASYLYGKPADLKDVVHLEAMRGRMAEVVDMRVVQAQLGTPAAVEPPEPAHKVEDATPPAPSLTSMVPSAPSEAPGGVTPPSPSGAPSGLQVEGESTAPGWSADATSVTGGMAQARAVNTGSLPGPHSLKCLYRGKEGRCTEFADGGHQWCAAHMAKLFEQIK